MCILSMSIFMFIVVTMPKIMLTCFALLTFTFLYTNRQGNSHKSTHSKKLIKKYMLKCCIDSLVISIRQDHLNLVTLFEMACPLIHPKSEFNQHLDLCFVTIEKLVESGALLKVTS